VKIDKDIEPRVREAYAAAVAGDADRFDTALGAVATDDDSATRALSLAFAIGSTALFSIHRGRRPDDVQLRFIASEFAAAQQWTTLDEVAALTFLAALADVKSPAEMRPLGNVTVAAFAIGAWLLSAFRLDEAMRWNDFLDAILDKLETSS
jgi:hypothetical protein